MSYKIKCRKCGKKNYMPPTDNIIVFNGQCTEGKEHHWAKDFRFKFRMGLTSLLILLTLTFAHSQSYTAIQDINVRSGPGTRYEVIDKVLSGGQITVIENGIKWTKISTNKGDGYVSSKYIQTESTSSSSRQTKKIDNDSIGMGSIIGGVTLIVLVLLAIKWIKLKVYNLFGFKSDEGGNSIYECYKCNETSMFRIKSSCPNGGYHGWREV